MIRLVLLNVYWREAMNPLRFQFAEESPVVVVEGRQERKYTETSRKDQVDKGVLFTVPFLLKRFELLSLRGRVIVP